MSHAIWLSPRAQRDLDDITRHSITQWGTIRAKAHLTEIAQATQHVAQNPQIGRDCSFIRTGYLKYPVGSHFLFYRIGADKIIIIHILHHRMDVARHL